MTGKAVTSLRAVSILLIVACADMASAQTIGDMKTVARDGEWELRQSKDTFSDKDSCVLMPSKRPHIQITSNSLYISYRGRGGVKGYTVRVDDEPPSQMQLPSDIEQGIQALGFQGKAFEQVLEAKRIRVQYDINIAGAKRLLARLRTLCPGNK
jgi:hypothetical protein